MSPITVEGSLDAAGKRFGIVAARWNEFCTDKLIQGAIDALLRRGVAQDHITLVRVPGSFEIPLAAQKLAEKGEVDAVIALGTLIKGETDHYQLIAAEVASGLSRVMAASGIPVAFGVVTAGDVELALARADMNDQNKGWEAASAAIEMANLMDKLK